MAARLRNVLVFPAGTEIGQEIMAALCAAKEVRLFAAGQDISNHARFSYPEYHVLPHVNDAAWSDAVCDLCRRLSIDFIFPGHDDALLALSRIAISLPAKIVSSPPETCEITRSKSATYRALAASMRVPKLYVSAAEIDAYPVLVKPDRGQGSAGVSHVAAPERLRAAMSNIAEPIICEYLPGEEYTVDCFSDRAKGVLFAGARIRQRIRNGISVNTRTVDLPEALPLARCIAAAMAMHGAWFFQLKRAADGTLALLEVAPRIAGSMAAHRVLGVNFPLLSIFEQERLPLSIATNPGPVELDRALANRYRHALSYSALYVDFDDTLIQKGKVATQVITLIYQCINRGLPVKLLTRHAEDITQSLSRHRLAGLFDAVIHLRKGEPKSAEIVESDAILVDDSYAERMEVARARGIHTFDCSMTEMLTAQAEDLLQHG